LLNFGLVASIRVMVLWQLGLGFNPTLSPFSHQRN